MSKLQKSYINLKSKDADKIYLFKSGMFYLALADDCEKLSSVFGFKKTKLNEEIEKCGFPISRLGFYVGQLEKRKIPFQIIDDDYSYNQNNSKLKKIISEIKDIDLDNITFKQADEFLENAKMEIGKIYE